MITGPTPFSFGDADSFGPSFNDEETRYDGQWLLTEAELAEVRKIPDEFWDQIAAGGPSAINWLFDYLESQGLTDGLDRETFPELVQAVSQDNKLIGMYVETVPDSEVGGQTGQRASRPVKIWDNLQQSFTGLATTEQQNPEEKEEEKEEEQAPEDDNVLTNEEFLEALRDILSNPNFQPPNSPLTGPWSGAVSPAAGAFTGQSFQAPLIGGQVGGNPLVAPSRQVGPSYASPVFAPVPGPSGPAADGYNFAEALEKRLRELFPDLFEDEGSEEGSEEGSDEGLTFYELAEKYPDADWGAILNQHMIDLHGEDAVTEFYENLLRGEADQQPTPEGEEVEQTFYEVASQNPDLDWNAILNQHVINEFGEDAVNEFYAALDPEGFADQQQPAQVSVRDFDGLSPLERIQLWNSLSPSEQESILAELGGQGSDGINELLLGNNFMGGGGASGQSNRSIATRSGDIVESAQKAADTDIADMTAATGGEPQVAEQLAAPQQPQEKQSAAPAPASPTAMPATAMSSPGGAGKGQPQAQQMGQAAQNLAQGLQPQQGQGTPLAGTASQSGMGGGLGAPTGRGMFTTK